MPPRPLRLHRRFIPAALIAVVVAAFGGGTASAVFVPDSVAYIQNAGSTEGLGAFNGSIAVDVLSPTSATIQITLTNLSPIANGGYITGFAFNDPNSSSKGNIGTVTSFSQSYTPAGAPPANNMALIGDPTFNNTISGSPFGSFDIGAAVGGDLLGGGSPQPGVEVNQTGVFTFEVEGSSLNKLTAGNILNTLSTGGVAFMVRFRGFEDGGSDKVIAGVLCDPPPPPPPPPPPGAVPAPAGIVLGLIGLGTCLGRGLRRRSPTVV